MKCFPGLIASRSFDKSETALSVSSVLLLRAF